MITSKSTASFSEALDKQRFVNLMSDAGFKIVYADKGNKGLLIELINHFLPEGIIVKDIVKYLDREQTPVAIEGKRTLLDLVCEDSNGSIISVEIQKGNYAAFFERCVYYGAGHYHGELSSGDTYDKLRPVYMIAILEDKMPHEALTLWDTDHYIAHYHFIESRTGEFAPSTIICNFAELGRFTKSLEECKSELDYLIYWFKYGWKYTETLPQEIEKSTELKELVRESEIAAFNKDKRTIYDLSLMNERDILTEKKYAREEGRAEGLVQGRADGLQEGLAKGREEGREEGFKEVASKMKESGIDISVITQITGLSSTQIESL